MLKVPLQIGPCRIDAAGKEYSVQAPDRGDVLQALRRAEARWDSARRIWLVDKWHIEPFIRYLGWRHYLFE